jgi:methylated-DNA-[protein]-cysteine S-methyltransferase
MNELCKAYYESELGIIEVKGNEEGIYSLDFMDKDEIICKEDKQIPGILTDCLNQLDEYFKGSRKEFDLKLVLQGTDFQKNVWRELLKVPFGKTASYKDIALSVGNVKAVRAVGGANGKNKIAIIIPCHRIIGKNGTLTGYAGGIWRKEWLLKHEGIL